MDREADYFAGVQRTTGRFQHKVMLQPLLNPERILPLPAEQSSYYSKLLHLQTYFSEAKTCCFSPTADHLYYMCPNYPCCRV